MRTLIAVMLLLGGACVADEPLTAHVVGSEMRHFNGMVYGNSGSGVVSGVSRATELRIGSMSYTIAKHCKVEVGKDYPARVDEKNVYLTLPDGKTCKARITGIREATAQ